MLYTFNATDIAAGAGDVIIGSATSGFAGSLYYLRLVRGIYTPVIFDTFKLDSSYWTAPNKGSWGGNWTLTRGATPLASVSTTFP
jgi:hypothetical protein